VLDAALEPLLDRAATGPDAPARLLSLRVVDPACGSGRFLVAAARRIARRLIEHRRGSPGAALARASSCVRGIDADPIAVELARAALREIGGDGAGVACADALLDDAASGLAGRCDAVVGNPPFIDSERSTRAPARRARLRSRFGSARGNFDLSTLFVELGLRLARVGGRVALITPRRLLASDGGRALQAMALTQRPVAWLELAGGFDAGIETGVLVIERTDEPGPHSLAVARVCVDERGVPTPGGETTLGALRRMPAGYLDGAWRASSLPPDCLPATGVTLADVAEASDAATTDEAYRLAPLLRDRPPRRTDVRVVNTGLIDPGRVLWGARPLRYLKRDYARPVVPLDALRRTLPRQAMQAEATKVVVAGLASRLEAAVLPPGWLAGKSVVVLRPRPGVCPHALAAWLNAPATNDLYVALFGGRGFGKGSMAIGPRQVERLPLADAALLRRGGPLSRVARGVRPAARRGVHATRSAPEPAPSQGAPATHGFHVRSAGPSAGAEGS